MTEAPDQSLAFFSRSAQRAEPAMLAWALFALLLVLATFVIGGPS
jgi:hypothetical protein